MGQQLPEALCFNFKILFQIKFQDERGLKLKWRLGWGVNCVKKAYKKEFLKRNQ